MKLLAVWMVKALGSDGNEGVLKDIAGQVQELCLRYPVPGIG